MVAQADKTQDKRTPLSRERVFEGAIELADREGFKALTMRRLADELGVEAMSIYYHVANKEALLDGIVDAIVAEFEEQLGGFEMPDPMDDWKAEVRKRCLTARSVMLRHKWAPEVFETRTSMSARLVMYFESTLGILIEGGFSYDLAHHSLHAFGSMLLGFMQQLFAPTTPEEDQASTEMFEHMMESLPYLATMMTDAVMHQDPDSNIGWCDDQVEFTFALDVLLDGLEMRLLAEQAAN